MIGTPSPQRDHGISSALALSVIPFLGLLFSIGAHGAEPFRDAPSLAPGESWSRSPGKLEGGYRGEWTVSIAAPTEEVRVVVELAGPNGILSRKLLHAGDPDFHLPCRSAIAFEPRVRLVREDVGPAPADVLVHWSETIEDAPNALEAEPNDDWRSANPLVAGQAVHGSADDADWLDNAAEGRVGIDWFRFDIGTEHPVLATFTLDLIDRDVSADLALFTVRDDRPEPWLDGKDPMEIVHDRERVRYSKNLARTLTKGTYFLRVNANHPAYVLRSRVSDVPPFDDPMKAVDVGLHYLLTAGDAWLGQVPREGNRFVRSANLHETSLRCTSCHVTAFPAEAALAAHRRGYEIEAKDALFNMVDRIADSPTPLYGGTGVFWQRFSATPMQGLAFQASILLDHDREIADVPLATLERFGPFLLAAWETRTDMPEDEKNVVPADSKFDIVRGSRRLLLELARRTGRDDYSRAAANIASIAASRAADRRVESLQDRIHRLIAWTEIDREANANKIRRETGALLALQNADGSWHENDSRPGPGSVYATGQLIDALLEADVPREHPAIARGLTYLLSQQEEFGGWFQPESHENFRTPMRETRWATIALARAFPRGAPANRGWGTAPSRAPRTDSVSHALDDLDATRDAPKSDVPAFMAAITAMLDHPSPLVRGSAASCLGRVGGTESIAPLVRALDDPSKIVRRAAGSGLRQLGNRGVGIDETLTALDSPSPRVRREIAALLNRQTPGFEGRQVVDRLIPLAGDPDFLTRFETVRALRRWFYRMDDAAARLRIVETLVERLGVDRDARLRRNLSENLYILMDENLGGGVSLQRHLAALPESARAPVLNARRDLERDAILRPILAALRDGGELQRSGLLRAFDGSFFAGRTYARRPAGAVDVGNDREFGFLIDAPIAETEPTFQALFSASLPGPDRRDAMRLADFFRIPEHTRDPAIRSAILAALDDPDLEARAEATRIVARGLSLEGAENDPKLTAAIAARLAAPSPGRPALIAAIGRAPALAKRPEVAAALSAMASRIDDSPDLLPVLDRLGLSDVEIVAAIKRGWDRHDVDQRSQALDVLLRLPPSDAMSSLLPRIAADPSEALRERALAALAERATSTDAAALAIVPAFADPSPKIRRNALAAASERTSFWDRADAMEGLARLLVDPDAEVRSDALDMVKHHRLLIRFPILARRIKAIAEDPKLGPRVAALLRATGRDPSSIAPDIEINRSLILDAETFRRDVNPLFYRPGPDGHSCADCHASHSLLRLAEPRRGGPTEEDVSLNLASATRVVDLARPESSLLLRKPLSPLGQGENDPGGPTGLTHVGGPRWDSPDDPAHRAILAWLRAAAAQPAPPASLAPAGKDPESLDPVGP